MRLPMLMTWPLPLDVTARTDLGQGSSRLAGATPAAVRDWLADQTRVSTAVDAFGSVYDLAEIVGAAEVLDLGVAQLPSTDPDTWAGATDAARAGAVSLVVQRGYAGTPPDVVAGVVVDTWNQDVVAPTQTTGLAIHHDRPSGQPPSALLVAVHPDPGAGVRNWDLDTLLEIVTSTLSLARDRATAAELCRTSGITVADPR
jgi:hypothetical protein